ncbi:dihydrofolate reductase [Xanthobacter dioxanivorans]|uniref:Dihydrofolate reductase n=1 Tax=Xanthobacter dioxanivorans TaxID=2528964 RepID=A0A974PU96_9HYPH|nr:dihydrofolate reductase [Xanthobacter dioxanivorans]QRG09869.1 dihydrofolate reductase [Xanthobacter dioxanivorans]
MTGSRHPLSLVVAVSQNGVIGAGGGLPWRLPSDLKRFRAITWGKPLLMGRRTFDSIGRPLPGRTSVVVSADPAFVPPEGVLKGESLAEALRLADAAADEMGADEIMVIGGERVFRETLPLARTVHLTEVHAAPEGDVHFPAFDRAQWREAVREGPLRGEKDEASFSYVTLVRAPA